ncbi:MAG: Malonyl-CoA decarboxylase [Desulfuromonas sp.]|nr:MAG: Malonyl-CoA decarboxylase [Desulfuromonas sp.]
MFKYSLKNLGRSWSNLTGSLLGDRHSRVDLDLANGDEEILRRHLDNWIGARGGEVSARSHAMQIGELYQHLSQTGRRRFLEILANEYGLDRAAMRKQCHAYLASDADYSSVEAAMRDLLEPPRLKLLSQFSALPNGIKFLVDLRRDLLGFCRENSDLKPFDRELRHLLANWFDVGLLKMRQVDWQSPAALLEKLVEYEAVHEINSWQDLRHRLHLDRRCYAFFHPNMPGEPLIFVEVALTNGIAESVQTLLDESTPDVDPEKADTAIFYSISNAQQGLKGISFGNFLIKRVVASLKAELPNIKTFATLSPIPGFRRWLNSLDEEERVRLIDADGMLELAQLSINRSAEPDLLNFLEQNEWAHDDNVSTVLKPILEKLLYHYFHTTRDDGQPIDPVERFHLGNGARIERVNWLGDVSGKGMEQSFGLMVNYLYPIKDIEKNHEFYATQGKIILSSAIKSLK